MGITKTTTDRASVWANHMEIKSASSSRLYMVAQCISGKNTGTWACSCPGFKGHKKVNPRTGRVTCKHLDNMCLLGPFPADAPAPKASAADTRHSFSDGAYAHYDTRAGFGSPDDWFEQADRVAHGRGRYRGDPGERTDTGTGGRRRQEREQEQQERQRADEGRRRRSDDRRRTRSTHAPGPTADMRLLELDQMPDHVAGLVAAMRKMARKLHPDVNKAPDAQERFVAMFAAYERLVRYY